jgi:hypothetical protein
MTASTQASQAALISGITVPDSKLATNITEFIRDTESTLLFNHSNRVYYFAPLAGRRRGFKFDAELLYAGAMFHDIGLVSAYSSNADRFEVDGANAARDFLRRQKISEQAIECVWTAIALHTTPGISQYMHPVVALVTAGVEMDVLGVDYASFTDSDRNAVVQAFPRTSRFKGRHPAGLLRRHQARARDNLRKCEGRRTRRQRSRLSPRQPL